jgi:glycogen debranching enzyme
MIEKEAYDKAIEVLEKCATPHGFHAAYPGYDAVWARDSVITSLGASLLKNKFKETFKQSLITLAKAQSKKGQIPNAVDIFSKRKSHIDFKSIDSSLWFIIGNYVYKKRYKDSSLMKKQKSIIQSAMTWLSYQDMGEDGMLEQQPTSDWQDAFPHRYGHTINTQALYYKALTLSNLVPTAKNLKNVVNNNKDDKLWNKNYYLPWRWKNHNKYHEKGEWFDSLGNFLAIIFDLADNTKSNKILKHIIDKKINKPFPVKAIYPPIRRGSKDWQDYFADSGAGTPFHYLNGGIWTFIGGFYILSLIKQKQFSEASKQLTALAKANLKTPIFSEWLNGKTGEASGGGNQAWNAGLYILAHDSLKAKRVLL